MRSVWGLMAALSAGAVIVASIDETGQERVAALFVPAETQVAGDFASQSEIADLSNELTRLRSETRLMALEREAMAIKIATLESEFGPITGSIPDPAKSNPAEIAGETVAETELEAMALTEDDLRDQAATSRPLEPKSVRTIDVGFVPLPKERKNAISPEAAAAEEPAIDPGSDGAPPAGDSR